LIPFATYRGDEPQIFSADKIPLIPWEEMPDRIADQERQKSSLWHVWKESKIGANDQNGLPYCHAASAVNGIALVRELAGLPYVELSIGSVGGPVTGYRKRGAYIIDDLEHCVKAGAASVQYVPNLQVSRNGWKDGAEEDALKHRIEEWYRLESRNVQQQLSALLQNFPVCVLQCVLFGAVFPAVARDLQVRHVLDARSACLNAVLQVVDDVRPSLAVAGDRAANRSNREFHVRQTRELAHECNAVDGACGMAVRQAVLIVRPDL
jgi:hypothetical protein